MDRNKPCLVAYSPKSTEKHDNLLGRLLTKRNEEDIRLKKQSKLVEMGYKNAQGYNSMFSAIDPRAPHYKTGTFKEFEKWGEELIEQGYGARIGFTDKSGNFEDYLCKILKEKDKNQIAVTEEEKNYSELDKLDKYFVKLFIKKNTILGIFPPRTG